MKTVKNTITTEHIGKVVRTHSKKFGDGSYLIIKANAKYFADYMKFVKFPYCHVMDWDSMINDEIIDIIDMEFEKLLNHIPKLQLQ